MRPISFQYLLVYKKCFLLYNNINYEAFIFAQFVIMSSTPSSELLYQEAIQAADRLFKKTNAFLRYLMPYNGMGYDERKEFLEKVQAEGKTIESVSAEFIEQTSSARTQAVDWLICWSMETVDRINALKLSRKRNMMKISHVMLKAEAVRDKVTAKWDEACNAIESAVREYLYYVKLTPMSHYYSESHLEDRTEMAAKKAGYTVLDAQSTMKTAVKELSQLCEELLRTETQ
jgi:hypothetical protein